MAETLDRKPTAKVIGENGNVFVTLGISSAALKKAGLRDKAEEMAARVFKAGSYEEALGIMQEYVDFR